MKSDLFIRTFIYNYIELSKHRNDAPSSFNIVKVNPNDKKCCRLAEQISVQKVTLACHVMSQSYFVL